MLKVRTLELKNRQFKIVANTVDMDSKTVTVTPYVVDLLKMVEVGQTRKVTLEQPYTDAPEKGDVVIEPLIDEAIEDVRSYCNKL